MLWFVIGTCMAQLAELPAGSTPPALDTPHFPTRLHAFVWRNWPLVPVERMASVVGAEPGQLEALGRSMGLNSPPAITDDLERRSYITVIRRNWHLLPYEQLLELLGWTPSQLAYTLREDDFLFIKLGSLKPACEPLRYRLPTEEEEARAAGIAALMRDTFPPEAPEAAATEPLFAFIQALSEPLDTAPPPRDSLFNPRYCYAYFAPYGDPLMDAALDPYPDGYLERLGASGVGGVWLHAVLYKLTPFPWDPGLSGGWRQRLERLDELARRVRKHGLGLYLYFNEPRAMPLAFFDNHPELKGITAGDHGTLCTSVPAVQDYLRDGVRTIAEAAPALAGFFTITASENLTSCWSHNRGEGCPRCGERSPAEVIAEVNRLVAEGLEGTEIDLIAWDWGWNDQWAPEAIALLPKRTALMSVSEWSLPVTRGGIESIVGEYSLSAVGPGPRATRHWAHAREHGLRTMAKVQANTTWELAAAPYVPAVANAARHAARLRDADVDGLMLSWTLGGYPSPNLEVFAELGAPERPSIAEALKTVAGRRFGEDAAPAVVRAWEAVSAAFAEYPYHIGVMYSGPQQMGPANLLWPAPTGYNASMVGLPYDDLDRWRAVFPEDVFIGQFARMADGFQAALETLRTDTRDLALEPGARAALEAEQRLIEACAIHFQSVANQARFIQLRDSVQTAAEEGAPQQLLNELEALLEAEQRLAIRLHALQSRDSRLGFEASNHYFYIPQDLAEKAINCRYLLNHWLPTFRDAG